jgi:hypothetical protein
LHRLVTFPKDIGQAINISLRTFVLLQILLFATDMAAGLADITSRRIKFPHQRDHTISWRYHELLPSPAGHDCHVLASLVARWSPSSSFPVDAKSLLVCLVSKVLSGTAARAKAFGKKTAHEPPLFQSRT